jgi:hypothetical protein
VKVKKTRFEEEEKTKKARVSVQGVESLWGDCRFIQADWGSYVVVDLCYFALFEDFSLKK